MFLFVSCYLYFHVYCVFSSFSHFVFHIFPSLIRFSFLQALCLTVAFNVIPFPSQSWRYFYIIILLVLSLFSSIKVISVVSNFLSTFVPVSILLSIYIHISMFISIGKGMNKDNKSDGLSWVNFYHYVTGSLPIFSLSLSCLCNNGFVFVLCWFKYDFFFPLIKLI